MLRQKYLSEKVKIIEERMKQLITHAPCSYKSIFDSAAYSLFSGGKRLRPILVMEVTEALGGNAEHALDAAIALEMIHTSSLIHDDMPCMDNDDFRRGKPTLHKVFPEWQALLTGDFFLTFAFECITGASDLTDAQKVALIQVLASKSGAAGMIGGQLLDLQGNVKTEAQIEELHILKTGALLEAAIEIGAIIAGSTPQEMVLLRSFAKDIGLAFQIIDDVLDVTAGELKHGHSSDAASGKLTYVNFLGIEGSKKRAEELVQRALSTLAPLGEKSVSLAEIARFIVERTY
ncbi:MAG: polyprenyl synthetase family protein [Chlamydiota bacterium]